jgi:hypothetical protein
MAIECDRCGVRFNLIHGGVCGRCGRILCRRHLHGSWLRQLLVDVGARPVCTDCRAGAPAEGKSADARPGAL